jgi:hypothetical protein
MVPLTVGDEELADGDGEGRKWIGSDEHILSVGRELT